MIGSLGHNNPTTTYQDQYHIPGLFLHWRARYDTEGMVHVGLSFPGSGCPLPDIGSIYLV